MDAATPGLEWSDLAQLLAVRRAGSLAGAARALGVDATTVGRRLKALEDALHVSLVKRDARSLGLTDAGAALADVAEATERGIADVRRRVAIEDEAPQGAVRLTTLEVLASRFVAPALPQLRARHPGLLLEIDTSPKVRDLARGEADLALRLTRPEEPGLVRRSLGSIALSAWVAPAWTQGRRRLSRAALREIPQVLYGLRYAVSEVDWLRLRLPDAPVALRTDSVSTALEAVRAGAGLGLLPDALAEGLVRVELDATPPPRGVWLAMHPTSARVPRVKTVVRFLAEAFAGVRLPRGGA